MNLFLELINYLLLFANFNSSTVSGLVLHHLPFGALLVPKEMIEFVLTIHHNILHNW
jgi:hypothetical protein